MVGFLQLVRCSVKCYDLSCLVSNVVPEQVKFSELTINTFRMLQCLEWEPSGSFYQSSGSKLSHNGAIGASRINYSQDITDPTLPANPRKAVLYRPSLTHFIAVSMKRYMLYFISVELEGFR